MILNVNDRYRTLWQSSSNISMRHQMSPKSRHGWLVECVIIGVLMIECELTCIARSVFVHSKPLHYAYWSRDITISNRIVSSLLPMYSESSGWQLRFSETFHASFLSSSDSLRPRRVDINIELYMSAGVER